MPEATEEATILIATSYQAWHRNHSGDQSTEVCDSIIVIIFACFFIEANLNHVIGEMKLKEEIKQFFCGNDDPPLAYKLGWFYNRFYRNPKATKDEIKNDKDFQDALEQKFPGFTQIRKFRNEIAHGRINRSLANSKSAESLRIQAKDIVDEFFKIAEKNEVQITRLTNYEQAITSSPFSVKYPLSSDSSSDSHK